MSDAHTPQDHPGRHIAIPLLLTLALLAAFSPMATDLYLPGFPDMVGDLGTDASGVQLTLTTFMLGLSAGQLVWGPLSDRFGRLWPLLLSGVICVVAGALAAVAPNLFLLVLARIVQGFTGAGGLVIGRAVVTDLTSGRDTARAMTLMMTVGGIAPILAPFAGSLMIGSIGWRGLLWVLAGAGAISVAAVRLTVAESLPSERRHGTTVPLRTAFRHVLSVAEYRRQVTVFVCAFGVLMSYIAASPFVYQNIIGLSEISYGLAFGANAVGMVTTGYAVSHLVHRIGPRRVVLTSVLVQLAATLAFVLLVLMDAPTWTYAVAIFFAIAPMGGILGPTAALVMAQARSSAGTGSALLGTSQHAFGALVSPLVGLGGAGSALVPAVIMLTCSALALLSVLRTAHTD